MFSLALREKITGKPSDYSDGLSLIIPEDIESAALPLGWCITPAVVSLLRSDSDDIGTPYLLISVGTYSQNPYDPDVYSLQEKYRRLVPLEQGMEFVDLFFEGKTYIAASIVVGVRSKLCEEYLSWRNSSNRYRETDYTQYENQLLIASPIMLGDGGLWSEVFFSSRSHRFGCSLAFLEVPCGVFAKKPWDYPWLTFLFGTPRDQCHLRGRRRLFAYTLQPFVVALLAVLFVLVASCEVGLRCLFLGAVWMLGFWGADRAHLFNLEQKDIRIRPGFYGENVYWKSLFAVMHFLSSRIPILRELEHKYSEWQQRQEMARTEGTELAHTQRIERNQATCDLLQTELTCLADPRAEVVIHPGRKTLALKFRALKAQVCRPFAQSTK